MTRKELLENREKSLQEYASRERKLVENTGSRIFGIYQLRDDFPDRQEYAFEPLARLNKNGRHPEYANYQLVYIYQDDKLNQRQTGDALEAVFSQFNSGNNVEKGFYGHSLSVSDVIVVSEGDKLEAWYVDSIGYNELQAFADDLMIKYKGWLIKISYSWGDEEPDIVVKNFDTAWKTMKKMVMDEAYTASVEHNCPIEIEVNEDEKKMFLHYTYDDTWCTYAAVAF